MDRTRQPLNMRPSLWFPTSRMHLPLGYTKRKHEQRRLTGALALLDWIYPSTVVFQIKCMKTAMSRLTKMVFESRSEYEEDMQINYFTGKLTLSFLQMVRGK